MKLNKKNKGKVHPSPPPLSSSSSTFLSAGTGNKDAVSALKLLPAAILALISVLSLEDREVLAYMITSSIKATANPAVLLEENRRRRSKRQALAEHKPPVFDCGCFDCYTSYWFRWDSSPNRELIHQAIEAFEEHLANGEKSKKSGRGKRKEKAGGRPSGGSESEILSERETPASLTALDARESSSRSSEAINLLDPAADLPESADSPLETSTEAENQAIPEEIVDVALPPPETPEVDSSSDDEVEVVARTAAAGGNHKGLARKVLPDVIGLINSRLWSLWSPNV